ncbi:DUF3265 domain-containing protein [Vibrio cholerae]|nr:DUF3265 domain-containing protein [Vibrio cholerae]WLP78982.1 DUF3265 domain-containing protein [Vibrio cholerae]
MIAYNKRFKRDFQRGAFLLCVDFGGFSVMRKLGSGVVSPLSGRYGYQVEFITNVGKLV